MARKYKRGDVVYMKSSGVAMTVKMYETIPDPSNLGKFKESEDTLICCWHLEKTKELKCESFHEEMLTDEDPEGVDYGMLDQ